jgi:hypothetical protein
MVFSDSIDSNIEVLRELLGGLPPQSRGRAARAASKIEKAVVDLQKDNSSDPAVALGVAFAIYVIAQRLVQASGAEGNGQPDGLIQLLS